MEFKLCSCEHCFWSKCWQFSRQFLFIFKLIELSSRLNCINCWRNIWKLIYFVLNFCRRPISCIVECYHHFHTHNLFDKFGVYNRNAIHFRRSTASVKGITCGSNAPSGRARSGSASTNGPPDATQTPIIAKEVTTDRFSPASLYPGGSKRLYDYSFPSPPRIYPFNYKPALFGHVTVGTASNSRLPSPTLPNAPPRIRTSS